MKRTIIAILSLTVLFCLISCSDAPLASGNGAYPIKWLGEFPSAPTEKVTLNNMYFNSTDRNTYIFNGKSWNIMTVSGINGASIRWLGSLSTVPDTATNHAFFNLNDKVSYVFTGQNGILWDTLTASGISINWLGEYPSEPINKKFNDAYYDQTLKCSRVWNGHRWDKLSADGLNGTEINWLGAFAKEPPAQINDAYYNETDFTSYIKTVKGWMVICKGGLAPTGGSAMIWLGSLDGMPKPGTEKLNHAFFNKVDGCSYIYTDKGWSILTKSGKDGVSIIWKGESDTVPEPAQLNWAYFNKKSNTSFIYNGKTWDIMCKGTIESVHGLSIIWIGPLDVEPVASSEKTNWAYHNTGNGNSYICTGTSWNLLVKAGKEGLSIIWKGEFDSFPNPASINWAFYHKKDGNSYIHNGSKWGILSKGGFNGVDGTSLLWKGTHTTHPDPAYKNWAYYNDSLGITYIFDGTTWHILAQDAKPTFKMVSGLVKHGDTLILNHNFGSAAFLDGQYVDNENEVHSWTNKDSAWKNIYEIVNDVELHTTITEKPVHKLFRTTSRNLVHTFTEAEGATYFMVLDINGNTIAPPVIVSKETVIIKDISEMVDGAILFAFITEDSTAKMVRVPLDGSPQLEMIVAKGVNEFRAIASPDSSIFALWAENSGVVKYTRYFSDGSSIPPIMFTVQDSLQSPPFSFKMNILNDGTFQVYDLDGSLNGVKSVYRIYQNNSHTLDGEFGVMLREMKCDAFQLENGTIIANDMRVGWKGRRYLNLASFSKAGHFDTSTLFSNGIPDHIQIKPLSYSLFFGAIDYSAVTDSGYVPAVKLQMYDSNLNLLREQSIVKNMLLTQITSIGDQGLGIIYVDALKPRSIRYAQVKLAIGTPRLILKKFDNSTAYLINNTGLTLELSLTASSGAR